MADRLAARERPEGAPVMRQRWAELLFLHWAWDPAEVQRTLPAGLTVDVWEGRAWLGVVPFFMRDVRPAWCPPVPGVSNFLELNLRTYVFDRWGRPGVWFYSLDANRRLAVEVARRFFFLPYVHAAISAQPTPQGLDFRVRRAGQEAESRYLHRAAGRPRAVQPDAMEFFLVERYRLFAHDARQGRLFTGAVAHAPYQVTEAEVPVWDDGPLRLAGFDPGGRRPDHQCAAQAVDVEVFPLELVEEPAENPVAGEADTTMAPA